MDNLQGLFVEVPPITRVWTAIVMVEHGMVELGVLPPLRLVFSPERAFGDQPWRLFTSFCFFGPLLISTMFAAWNSMKWINTLENDLHLSLAVFPPYVMERYTPLQTRQLQQSMDKLWPLDFLWFLTLVAASIVAIISFGYYHLGYSIPVLSSVFYDVLSYLACRINPHLHLGVFGIFTIPGTYVPYFMLLFEWVIQPHFKTDIMLILLGNIEVLGQVMTSIYAWKSFCGIILGHAWWFIYMILFDEMYLDKKEERRRRRGNHGTRAIVPDAVRLCLRQIVMPPWYHLILYNINSGRFDRQR